MFQELYHWVFSISCPSLHPSIYAHSFSYSSWETWTWVMKFYTEGNCKGNRPRWFFDIRQSLFKSTSFFTNKTKQVQENTLLKLDWIGNLSVKWIDSWIGQTNLLALVPTGSQVDFPAGQAPLLSWPAVAAEMPHLTQRLSCQPSRALLDSEVLWWNCGNLAFFNFNKSLCYQSTALHMVDWALKNFPWQLSTELWHSQLYLSQKIRAISPLAFHFAKSCQTTLGSTYSSKWSINTGQIKFRQYAKFSKT